jgi:hypothetical protein
MWSTGQQTTPSSLNTTNIVPTDSRAISSPSPTPTPTPTQQPAAKLSNDQLDQYVTIGGVRKTYRSALQEGLIDEFGNIKGEGAPSGPTEADLNQYYQPAYDYLNQYEQNLKGQLPSVLQEAQNQYNTYQSILGANKQQTLGALDVQKSQAQQRQDEANAASRRLFNELQVANQQRFGGSTSAGEAAATLQGRELQRTLGGNQREMGNFLQNYNVQKNQADTSYNTGLLQLQQQKDSAINAANADFQNKMLEIQKNRSGLAQEKAAKSIENLQNYRNQIFQIQMQNAQFQQALQAQKQQSDLQLQNSLAQYQAQAGSGQSALSSLLGNTNLNPTTQFGIGGTNNSGSNAYTGSISSRREDLTGQIYPIAQLADGRMRYSDGSIR